MHLDWAASQFLTKQWQVGVVGYWYNQISCDSGSGDRVGCFESRVAGIGPQIGYVIPLSKEWQGYLNLKGYGNLTERTGPMAGMPGSHSPLHRPLPGRRLRRPGE